MTMRAERGPAPDSPLASAALGRPSLPTVTAVADVNRLVLCAQGNPRTGVDGVWWPRSADLRTELPDLVAVFSRWLGTVHRVVYDPSAWRSAPSRIIRHNSAVTVDPYQMVDRELIYLMGTHSRNAVLFVLPPSCDEDVARRTLQQADESSSPLNATELKRICAKRSA
jgi:hypothetical protein